MRHLLLVEDDGRLRHVLQEALEEAEWTVTQASSGDEAKSILDNGAIFDALVTDVRMPGKVDGIRLARYARQIRDCMKVVVISGYMGTEVNRVVQDGLGAFLPKPFTMRQLQAQLELS